MCADVSTTLYLDVRRLENSTVPDVFELEFIG